MRAGEFNDLERRRGPHAGKLVDQKPQQGAAFGVVQHLDQPAELDAVGMGLYLDRSWWELPGARMKFSSRRAGPVVW
jgi:hypothetical protein